MTLLVLKCIVPCLLNSDLKRLDWGFDIYDCQSKGKIGKRLSLTIFTIIISAIFNLTLFENDDLYIIVVASLSNGKMNSSVVKWILIWDKKRYKNFVVF